MYHLCIIKFIAFTLLLASTFAADCVSQPSNLRVCSISHTIPASINGDTYGDSSVYNTLFQNPSTSRDCAQAYADYECSSLYPTCDSTLPSPGTTPPCRSQCNDFISKCQGQLADVQRPDCSSLPTSKCTSNSGSELDSLYPPPKKISGGAIAGIVIGVIVFVVIIVVIVVIVKKNSGGGGGRVQDHREERREETKTNTDNKSNKGKTKGGDIESGTGAESTGVHLSVRSESHKAKAPDSPSPRLSMTVNAAAVAAAAAANPASEREAKIKEQLDALPEAHRKPPPPWGIYFNDDAELYYWNSETDESTWEWPIKD